MEQRSQSSQSKLQNKYNFIIKDQQKKQNLNIINKNNRTQNQSEHEIHRGKPQNELNIQQQIMNSSSMKQIKIQTKNSQTNLNQFMKKMKTIDLKILKNANLTQDEANISNPENQQGIEITQKQIEECFKILDPKQNGQKITLNELQKKIAIINPNFPLTEVAQLTNNKSELKSSELFEILQKNKIFDYNPIEEAYKLIQNNENLIDFDKIAQFFKLFGFGQLDKIEVNYLKNIMDINKDGKVNLEDLNYIFELDQEQLLKIIRDQLNSQ